MRTNPPIHNAFQGNFTTFLLTNKANMDGKMISIEDALGDERKNTSCLIEQYRTCPTKEKFPSDRQCRGHVTNEKTYAA